MNNSLWNNAIQTAAVKAAEVDGPVCDHLHSALMVCFEFPHCIIIQQSAALNKKCCLSMTWNFTLTVKWY